MTTVLSCQAIYQEVRNKLGYDKVSSTSLRIYPKKIPLSVVTGHLGLGGSSEGFDLDGEDWSDWLHSSSRLQYTVTDHRGRLLE